MRLITDINDTHREACVPIQYVTHREACTGGI